MNNSHHEAHVAASLNRIRVVFEKASAVIEALPVGKKITATGLAEQLAEDIGMKGPSLYPTLKWLYEGYPGVKITRGAHGGIEKLPPDNASTSDVAVSDTALAVSSDTKPPSEAD